MAHFTTIEHSLSSTVASIWSMILEHKIIARGSGVLGLVAALEPNIN